MNVEYINPFIESLTDFFTTKLKTDISQGDLGVSKGEVNVREFVAFIGYQGAVQGIIALMFPVPTALSIASAFEKKDVKIVDDTVTDYIGSIVTAIAKKSKDNMPEGGGDIKVTSHAVLRGTEFSEKYPGGVWLEVPFGSSFGDFKLRVALKGS